MKTPSIKQVSGSNAAALGYGIPLRPSRNVKVDKYSSVKPVQYANLTFSVAEFSVFKASICGRGSYAKRAACMRMQFQAIKPTLTLFTLLSNWGVMMASIRNPKARAKEARLGAQALRSMFSYGCNPCRIISVRSSPPGAFAKALIRVQAMKMKVYEVLSRKKILSSGELLQGMADAEGQFGDTGGVVEEALKLIEKLWTRVPKKQRPAAVAERVRDLCQHQNYVVATRAVKQFVKMAPDLPTSVIVTAIAAFKKRIKNGTSYTHNGRTWQVSVPLVKAEIKKVLPKLQKIVTQRKKLKP